MQRKQALAVSRQCKHLYLLSPKSFPGKTRFVHDFQRYILTRPSTPVPRLPRPLVQWLENLRFPWGTAPSIQQRSCAGFSPGFLRAARAKSLEIDSVVLSSISDFPGNVKGNLFSQPGEKGSCFCCHFPFEVIQYSDIMWASARTSGTKEQHQWRTKK